MYPRFDALPWILLLALISCKDEAPNAMPDPNVGSAPIVEEQSSTMTPEQVESLAPLSMDLDAIHREIKKKQDQMGALVQKYQARGGELPPDLGTSLTVEQRELLGQKIESERRSNANLLRQVLEKDTEISDEKFNVLKLQSQLPHYVTANEGDRHDRMVMDFLVGETGLSEKKAWSLVSSIDLQQPLLPGFNVWMYYDSGNFGSWVTQGTATASPQEVQQRILVKPESKSGQEAAAKVVYIERRAKDLSKEVAALEQKRNELQSQVEELAAEEKAILDQLKAVRTSLAQSENATRYIVGSKKQLKKDGVISTSFLKGTRLKSIEGFDLLNLGQSTEIIVEGNTYGLSKIKKVTLLPKVFEEGKDYQVHRQLDEQSAKVAILNPEKFRQFKFVVVVE